MDSRETAFDPAANGWEQIEDTGFIGCVGPVWQRRDGDVLSLGFIAEPKHHNRRGVVQGGMLATLLDRAIGMAVFEASGGRPQATVQLDMHFLDAVQIGEFVEARCQIDRRTRSVTFATGTAFVGKRPVASAKGIWKMLGID
ncbi:PaaI family thioesterase [Aurantimonas sp. E1-2-R+4]|uniref:PaaI family thioesterase n=1 Tax=Aurantimonas sp. E1-2-R+4 TaxID=3113714 RepID=UPI002F925C36